MSYLRHVSTDKRLSWSTKLRIYQTLVLSVLLYALEIWILIASDTKSLESLYMKCLRHISGIRWYDRICNTEIAEHTGLSPLIDLISRRCNSLFGHVAKLVRTPQHIKLFSARLTSLLDVFLIALGNVHQVAQEASGRIRFVLSTTSHLLIYADVLSIDVILGWRNGSSQRDDDDVKYQYMSMQEGIVAM